MFDIEGRDPMTINGRSQIKQILKNLGPSLTEHFSYGPLIPD